MKIPNKITIIRKINNGNFGEVYLGENNFLNKRKEAIKIIKGSHKDLDNLKNNLFESSVLEYLRGSQYVVNIYSAEIATDGFVINMEYMKNGSVQALLDKNNFLNTKQVIKIAICVLQAMEYAHIKKILHLDIKPGNILIENNNIYKLSDFGLAGVTNEHGVCDFKKIYRIHYPPEKLNGQPEATEQTDIYMFGVTLYRLVNGDSHLIHQFEKKAKDQKQAIIDGKIPDRSNYLPHVPRKIRLIINKCINIDLSKRYISMRDIKKDFGKLKINYDWKPKVITEKMINWNCYYNNQLIYDLYCEKNQNSKWDIILFKVKNKKTKIKKYCHKNLNVKCLNKCMSKIFNDFVNI